MEMTFQFVSLIDEPLSLMADGQPNIVIDPRGSITLDIFQVANYKNALHTLTWKNQIEPIQSAGEGFNPDGVTIELDANSNLRAVTATALKKGIVRPDDSTIKITDGVISAVGSGSGGYEPDGSTIDLVGGKLHAKRGTKTEYGTVKADNTTIEASTDGVLSAKIATAESKGIVQPDNSTIKIVSGKLTGLAPDNSTINLVDSALHVADIVGTRGADNNQPIETATQSSTAWISRIINGINGLWSTVAAKYTKPTNGIPAGDIEAGVIPTVATSAKAGIVKPDTTSITVDTDGTMHASQSYSLPIATDTILGGVKVDVQTASTTVPVGINASTQKLSVQVATSTGNLGVVKVDGTSTTIDSDGTIHATGGESGGYEPDGSTIDLVNNQLHVKLVTGTAGTETLTKLVTATDSAPNWYDKFINTINGLITSVAKKYEKPETGITDADLSPQGVVAKVAEKYKKPEGGIPASDLAEGVIPAPYSLPIASNMLVGGVRIDNSTLQIDGETGSLKVPTAFAEGGGGLGLVKPDGISISIDNTGMIKSVSSNLMAWQLIGFGPTNINEEGEAIPTGGAWWRKLGKLSFVNQDIVRFRVIVEDRDMMPGGKDGISADVDFNIWVEARDPVTILGHDLPYDVPFDIVWKKDSSTPYPLVELWIHRGATSGMSMTHVSVYYQDIKGTFTPQWQPDFNITDTTSLTIETSKAHATATTYGTVKVDGTTVSINSAGVISAGVSEGMQYELPVASGEILGGIKADGVSTTIDSDGTLHALSGGEVVPYTLPIATESILGGVKIDGSTITMDETGQIHAAMPEATESYLLPIASNNILGGIKVDESTVIIDADGTLHATQKPDYELPIASDEVLGGVKSDGLTTLIDEDGIIHATQTPAYELPIASDEVLGGVKVDGSTILIDEDGKISADIPEPSEPYELPVASDSVLGGIKLDGSTATIDEDGKLHITQASEYELPTASESILGGVKLDGSTIKIGEDGKIRAVSGGEGSEYEPDGRTIGINAEDKLYAKSATDIEKGIVKPDNTSIIITDGVISAVAGLGGRATFDLSDQCNGTKTVFEGDFSGADTAIVFVNGIEQVRGYSYSLTDTTLTLTSTAPAAGSKLIIECFGGGGGSSGHGGGFDPDGVTIDLNGEAKLHAIKATPFTHGTVKADGITTIIDRDGIISAAGLTSVTWDQVDNKPSTFAPTIGTGADQAMAGDTSLLQLGTTSTTAKAGDYEPDIATGERLGVMRPDGTSTIVSDNGVISAIASLPVDLTPDMATIDFNEDHALRAVKATNNTFGIVKADGDTISIEDGIISANIPEVESVRWDQIEEKPDTYAPIIGTEANQAMAGNTPLLQIGLTADTALAGNTILLTIGTGADQAMAGNTVLLKIGITSDTAKAGDYVPTWTEIKDKPDTYAPITGTGANQAMPGNTALLKIGNTATTAMAGNTALLQLGSTATTALAGNTALLKIGTTDTTALKGSTPVFTTSNSGWV